MCHIHVHIYMHFVMYACMYASTHFYNAFTNLSEVGFYFQNSSEARVESFHSSTSSHGEIGVGLQRTP